MRRECPALGQSIYIWPLYALSSTNISTNVLFFTNVVFFLSLYILQFSFTFHLLLKIHRMLLKQDHGLACL